MIRIVAALALAFVLAVPATGQAISIVLVPHGGDPMTDGVTELMAAGGLRYDLDFYLDIGGLPSDVPNQAFANDDVLGSIFSYQFSFLVDPAQTQYVGFEQSCGYNFT